MKKNIALLILVLSFIKVNAQTEKGKWFIAAGIPLRFTQQTYDIKSDFFDQDNQQKNIQLGIAPNVGYFIKDDFLIGLAIPTTYRKSEFKQGPTTGQGTTESWSILFDPYIQYYFLKSEKLQPYIKGEFAIGSLWTKEIRFNIVETTSSVLGYGAGVGAAYWLNQNIGLHTELIYGSNTIKQKDDPDDFRFIRTGIDIRVGFSISI